MAAPAELELAAEAVGLGGAAIADDVRFGHRVVFQLGDGIKRGGVRVERGRCEGEGVELGWEEISGRAEHMVIAPLTFTNGEISERIAVLSNNTETHTPQYGGPDSERLFHDDLPGSARKAADNTIYADVGHVAADEATPPSDTMESRLRGPAARTAPNLAGIVADAEAARVAAARIRREWRERVLWCSLEERRGGLKVSAWDSGRRRWKRKGIIGGPEWGKILPGAVFHFQKTSILGDSTASDTCWKHLNLGDPMGLPAHGFLTRTEDGELDAGAANTKVPTSGGANIMSFAGLVDDDRVIAPLLELVDANAQSDDDLQKQFDNRGSHSANGAALSPSQWDLRTPPKTRAHVEGPKMV
ncbi:hypothetical protein BDK51DRAFT_49449 [Blyttiomyces helicus]|uniref:Uncharacterized protein n=1 Tax=Blyttiomyces helicus TaxID=388810 RepID=A0A4P9WF11_9FUNG|nr:hypothetical protein BDK51DRAFT_49449 [Blyttiomyces helicus]|eukprot:RKO90313.1 hypothetical protein BDK51DRAFT_49449 [Blyttiomyces helicus]